MTLTSKVPVLQGTQTKLIPRIYSVYMTIIKTSSGTAVLSGA